MPRIGPGEKIPNNDSPLRNLKIAYRKAEDRFLDLATIKRIPCARCHLIKQLYGAFKGQPICVDCAPFMQAVIDQAQPETVDVSNPIIIQEENY